MNMDIPKVELHVHLDGSVRLKTLAELAHISLEEANQRAVASYQCKSLKEYLSCFDLPCQVMQTKDNLVRIAKELGEDLEKEHVIYAEVRFNPLAHTQQGLTLEEVVEAVLEGLSKANFPIRLILCMMRNETNERNVEIISLAKRYLGKGVVALDLAGDESSYSTASFAPLFSLAHQLEIPYTIHAGESAGAESIRKAIDFGARRIGHGVHILEDQNLLMEAKEKGLFLEMCPTSNIQTKAISNIQKYPLWELYKQGVKLSVNTDNRTVSFTTLAQEYKLLGQNFPLSFLDFCEMNKMAIEASFLEDSQKEELLEYINQYLKQFS